MPSKQKKFYVVWVGRTTGIFDNWPDCSRSVQGYRGAQFKGFEHREEAEQAYTDGASIHMIKSKKLASRPPTIPKEVLEGSSLSLAVDGACSGATHKGEFRGVLMPSLKEVFKFGPWEHSTNNIMEFLAIYKGFKWMEQRGLNIPIYSDSKVAICWFRQTPIICRTKNPPPKGSALLDELDRAYAWMRLKSAWIQANLGLIKKWDTGQHGEIPADFGRK